MTFRKEVQLDACDLRFVLQKSDAECLIWQLKPGSWPGEDESFKRS